ncbi:hypothetical protein [Bradyrhizobium sp. LTSPM299]|jgi:hypothetical protein|nr:hypothetical protein [Bradyrhizobium sp. LTSPM299]
MRLAKGRTMRLDRAYKRERSDHWIKSKNRDHPVFRRVNDRF